VHECKPLPIGAQPHRDEHRPGAQLPHLLPAVRGRVRGKGLHSSTCHLSLSRFVTETSEKSTHIRPKSGQLCTAVFGPYKEEERAALRLRSPADYHYTNQSSCIELAAGGLTLVYVPLCTPYIPTVYPLHNTCITPVNPLYIPYKTPVYPLYTPCTPHIVSPYSAGVDNAAEYRATRHAMNVVGVSAAEQDSVMRVVAGILHLGNVTFTSDDDDGQGLTLVHFLSST